MQVTLKLFASLSSYLPEGAERNQCPVEITDGTTAGALIEQFRVPKSMAHLVLLNGVYLSPEDRARRKLGDGDELAVFPPVAGG